MLIFSGNKFKILFFIKMAYLSYVILSVISEFAVQIHSVPIESNWLVDATNSIKVSTFVVESFGTYKNSEQIKMIADKSFDSFSSSVEEELSEMIEQIGGMKSGEASVLESKVTKWLNDLRTLKYDKQEKNDQFLGKFLLAMDYMSKEVVSFCNNYNVESSESKSIMEKLKLLTQSTVTELAECAKSVKNQVSEIIDDTSEITDDYTDYGI